MPWKSYLELCEPDCWASIIFNEPYVVALCNVRTNNYDNKVSSMDRYAT